MRRLAIKVNELSIGQDDIRKKVGGLSRSLGYAFENEAYRMLPKTLKERYGIELKERLIRKVIDDSEINILGIGMRGGKEVVVVGEAKVRIEDMVVFDELEEHVFRCINRNFGCLQVHKSLNKRTLMQFMIDKGGVSQRSLSYAGDIAYRWG